MKEKTKNRIILVISLLLISFGTINLSTSIYAQENMIANASETQAKSWDRFWQDVFEQLISIVLPFVGGGIGIAIKWANTKGLQVSAEAEQYIINSAQAIVANQSRILFKNVYNNKELLIAWSTHKLSGKSTDTETENLQKALSEYANEAKNKAVEQLKTEIESSKFKKIAKDMAIANIEELISRTYTQNQIEKAKRAKNLLLDLVPIAIDSALLYYEKKEFTDKDKQDIIKKGFEAIAANFTHEFIVVDRTVAEMHLEAELKRKLELR